MNRGVITRNVARNFSTVHINICVGSIYPAARAVIVRGGVGKRTSNVITDFATVHVQTRDATA